MSETARRWLLVPIIIGVIVSGVLVLRRNVMATDDDDVGAALDVVIRGHVRNPVAHHGVRDMTEALVAFCEVEVEAEMVEFVALDDTTFRFRLEPGLGRSDQRRMQGCLEDAAIPRLQGDVLTMERSG
jgi:hypothetical protein